MAEYRGIEYMRKKLNRKRSRVLRRYKFYEMKNIARDMGIATPPSLQWLQAVLGWNAKAVDSIADRLEFRGFRDDNFDMTGIFRMNKSRYSVRFCDVVGIDFFLLFHIYIEGRR